MGPTFSIIVSLYNQAHFLPQLCAALAQQTYGSFEVIFCDDGSTDDTEAVLDALTFGDEETAAFPFASNYLRHARNTRSYAKTMNLGVQHAVGKHLLFIAGDSFPEPNYLEVLAEYVQEDRIVCGIRVQLDTIDGKQQAVDFDWRLKKEQIPTAQAIIAAEPWALMTGNGLSVPAAALRLYGPWREDFVGYGGEDNELIARLYFKGYVCWSVPDLRLYHHWHPAKASEHSSSSKAVDAINSYAR